MGGGNGTWWYQHLVWDVQGAAQLGLQADVVISAGSGESATAQNTVPAYPDPSYGTGKRLWHLTTAGYDYVCGVTAIMRQIRADLGANAPTQWEVANEPDLRPEYNGSLQDSCSETNSYGGCGAAPSSDPNYYNVGGFLCGQKYASCGPLEAAGLWELAQDIAVVNGWGNEEIAAMTVHSAISGWVKPYVQQINVLHSTAFPNLYPTWWGVHDYEDPTAGGINDLLSFERTLAPLVKKPARVWVTESGNNVAAGGKDKNPTGVHPQCSPGQTGDESQDPSNVLGCLVDNKPSKQALGAHIWRLLGTVRHLRVRTTEVYWFEFQDIGGWDSALLDHNGHPRNSFCALTGASSCNGNPDEWLGSGSGDD